jgi:hypothetical protein
VIVVIFYKLGASFRRTVLILFFLCIFEHSFNLLIQNLTGTTVPSRSCQTAAFLTAWTVLKFRGTAFPGYVYVIEYALCVAVGVNAYSLRGETLFDVISGLLVGSFFYVFNHPLAEDAFVDSLEKRREKAKAALSQGVNVDQYNAYREGVLADAKKRPGIFD